jgi:hypothetical protein
MAEGKIVISVSGGNVNGIFTNRPNVEVWLLDYDNLKADPSADCYRRFPTNSLDELSDTVASELELFPCLEKVLQ